MLRELGRDPLPGDAAKGCMPEEQGAGAKFALAFVLTAGGSIADLHPRGPLAGDLTQACFACQGKMHLACTRQHCSCSMQRRGPRTRDVWHKRACLLYASLMGRKPFSKAASRRIHSGSILQENTLHRTPKWMLKVPRLGFLSYMHAPSKRGAPHVSLLGFGLPTLVRVWDCP